VNQSKIAIRYAKSIFELAKEKNQVEIINADLELVYNTANTFPEFRQIIESPIVKSSQKAKIVSELFKSKVSALSLSFLNLIIQNKREYFITDIARRFFYLYRVDKGIKSAVLTTAVEVDEATKNKLVDLIGKVMNTKVSLTSQVNENLIGGFILKIGDNQYDASVATGLKKIKRKLINTSLEK
jgi:F-type H+-transporting ATPase subunit delta